ncbi:hypothetical protein [Actinoplanes utahensis]|uniref:DUF3592 domain-containing protein n=1 Tax=Actinoplanes utahensis TaxID=1869 RepID=A0A0A6USY7_ACTUT|nr:hypothetical protein [Actinoplanes utahensis]KHD79235.1 hypothetical protein MB27_01070 [Actinoplanes utahensis]GIF30343.1 hypothetical protein Aut01nite_33290 [Actinoplanes utahensis]
MNLQSTAHRIAWGLILLVLCLLGVESYGGLLEWRFQINAVPVEARVDRASVAPDWTVAFPWNGELHTAYTERLSGSPLEGDRIPILVDPNDPAIVASPGMTLDDWSDLPDLIAVCVVFVLIAVLILWRVRLPAVPPAPPLPRPRGTANRFRHPGGRRPARRRQTRRH